MSRPQGRVARLRYSLGESRPCSLIPRRAIPARRAEEEEDPFSSGTDDDEVCGVDFVTLEPITGAECRRLRAEEQLLQAHAAAVTKIEQDKAEVTAATAAETTTKTKRKKSSKDNDGYDFFGRSRIALNKNNNEDGDYSSSSSSGSDDSSQPLLPLRTRMRTIQDTALTPEKQGPTFLGGIRPSYRASPLFEEFQRQKDTSTAAKILFLDEGGEFRAALGAALLKHMLSRLRTSLDVTIECASLGPIAGRRLPSRDLQRTAAAMGVVLNPVAASRQFEEVADAVRYDLILVMDRFDYQEVIREVSMLDAINPGGNYRGRVRVLGPFGMAARRATPGQIVQDIADPLYDMHTDTASEQTALQNAAQDLAFACRGLATYLLDLQAKCGEFVTLREAVAVSLRCPLLAGELPSQRDRNAASSVSHHRIAQDDYFTVRAINGQRRVVRKPSKPRGFWKDPENIENELKMWMKTHNLDRLPTQKELRAGGASSLAAAIDKLGGLAGFSKSMGVAMASRRPNGYWNDFDNLGRALQAYMKPVENYYPENTTTSSTRINNNINNNTRINNSTGVESSQDSRRDGSQSKRENGEREESVAEMQYWMPSVQDLTTSGRTDLLRAIREHGGLVAVAKKLGVKVRRGSGWDEAKILQELRNFAALSSASKARIPASVALSNGSLTGEATIEIMPTRDQLIAAGRGDIASAVNKLGGFSYFRELYQSTRSIRKPSFSSFEDSGGGNTTTSNGTSDAFSTTISTNSSSKTGASSPPATASAATVASEVLVLHDKKLSYIEDVAEQLEQWMSSSIIAPKKRIPTRAELVTAGHEDLWALISRCGGGRRVAEHMGLDWVETRGRRKKSSDDEEEHEGYTSSGASDVGDPRSEIHMLDAYEEFVFI